MSKIKDWLVKLSLLKKILIVLLILAAGWFVFSKITSSGTNKVQYQTSTVQKGTLIVSVTGSGTVAATNNSNITTEATGVVKKLFVKDGDEVKTGDKIAELELDLEGQQKNSQAYSSYLSAQNSSQSAKDALYSVQSDLFSKWQTYFNLATSKNYENGDGTPNTPERQSQTEFLTTQDNWLSAEAKYKLQEKAVTQAQTSLNSAWYSYQQASPTIYAPISGTVSGLSLQIGSVINSQSSSNTSATTNKIAAIRTDAMPTISINLSEIDVPKVKVGDKATVTFDAFPDKTFTGKVISIDLSGSVSSNVTSYPAVILLDIKSEEILPNMAASASIITNTKDEVLMIPSTAVTTQNGSSTVQVMKNGKPASVAVEIGLASDENTEITSGLSEGDVVVTSTTQQTSTNSTTNTTSPFGSFSGGGNAFRIAR